MKIKLLLTLFFIPLVLLCGSCKREMKISSNQLLGVWVPDGESSGNKRFNIKPDGVAIFENMNASDFFRDRNFEIPEKVNWEFQPEEKVLSFIIKIDSAVYDYSGRVEREHGDIVILFTVGDPDEYKFKRFIRATKREVNAQANQTTDHTPTSNPFYLNNDEPKP